MPAPAAVGNPKDMASLAYIPEPDMYIHADSTLTPDWTHIFLSVLPPLPLGSPKDENRLVLALKAACAGIMTRLAHSQEHDCCI